MEERLLLRLGVRWVGFVSRASALRRFEVLVLWRWRLGWGSKEWRLFVGCWMLRKMGRGIVD